MEQIVHPISLTEIIPLKVQLFLVLLLGGGSFAQLPPPCPRVYVAVCERMCTYTRQVKLLKNYSVTFSVLLSLIGPFFCEFPELNTE